VNVVAAAALVPCSSTATNHGWTAAPEHAGLAVTIAATWEHFYYATGPLFSWLAGRPASEAMT
jgi:hypothetical protein